MNTKQKNKLVSYAATETVLRANPEVANVAGLPAKLSALTNRIAEIHDLALVQGQPLGVSRAKREALFASMAALTMKVAGVVMKLARDRRSGELDASGAGSHTRGACDRDSRGRGGLTNPTAMPSRTPPVPRGIGTLPASDHRIRSRREGATLPGCCP